MKAALEAELEEVLFAGDAERCIDFFVKLSPEDRRRLWPRVKATSKKLEHGEHTEVEKGTWKWVSEHTDEQRACARVALLATCTEAELVEIAAPGTLERACDLWERLRPAFLPRAAELVISATPFNIRTAYALVKRGLSERPAHENYTLGLLTRAFRPFRRGDTSTLADYLLENPDLLEHEIWTLFEVEGSGENSLAAHDKYSHGDHTWSAALLRLMRDGHLARDRLIDATLSALERDYAPFRAGWFSRFYAALEPSESERAARSPRFVALLGSTTPATVALALGEITALEKHAPIAASELAPALAPVTLSRHKSTATRCLKLLSRLAARDAGAKQEVARACVLALGHEAADVQKAALDLLERTGDRSDADLIERLRTAAPSVVATLKPRLAAWLPENATQPVAELIEPPTPTTRVAALDPSRALEPLSSLEELVFAHARVLEDDSDPMEIERVLDGVARLSALRPADFESRTGPLVKRARQRAERFWDRPLIHCLACLALAWTAPVGRARERFLEFADAEAARKSESIGFGSLFFERLVELARQLDERPGAALVSMPTHRGGFIDPLLLVLRLKDQPDPGKLDLVIALMRLAAERRAEALEIASSLSGDAGAALRHALGAPCAGDPESPWNVAASARLRACAWRVSTRKSGKYTFHELSVAAEPKPPPNKRADRPAELVYQPTKYGKTAGWTRSLVAWSQSVWPTGREAFFFDALPSLAGNIDWSGAMWEHVAYYELLRDPLTELGVLGRVALGIGLAAKEPGENGVATDAAIAALEEGRIHGAALGETLLALRDSGLVNLKRWSRTLGIVARTSALHSQHVRTAIERSLRGDPKAAPRDEGALVALLCELLAESGARIADPEAWSYLSASRHGKKVAGFGPQ